MCGKPWFVVPNIIRLVDVNRLLEKSNRRTPSRQPTVSDKAKEIIIREKASNVLLRMLKDKDNKVRCRGASCLFRLAQDGKLTIYMFC